jgi:iron complex transport system substrate-binding protein
LGTLADAVLTAAGFSNLGAASGFSGYGFIPLETVVATPPDLLIHAGLDDRRPSQAERLLLHPALARSAALVAAMDGPLFGCGGPFTATAVKRLAEIRAGMGR